MENLACNYSIKYLNGGYAVLSEFWHDENVMLNENKFFYITDGEIIIKINGVEHLCKAGEVVFIPSGVKHDYYLSHKQFAKKYWFHFILLKGDANLFDEYDLPITIPVNNQRIEGLFKQIITRQNNFASLEQASKIMELSTIYLDQVGARKTSTHGELDEIIKFINENPTENFSLYDLAEKANLSVNYFIKKFSKQTGLSPIKYLNKVRLQKAKTLLLTTNLTIAEIMRTVGIYDSSYFSKLIKSETGYSPRVFRKISSEKK